VKNLEKNQWGYGAKNFWQALTAALLLSGLILAGGSLFVNMIPGCEPYPNWSGLPGPAMIEPCGTEALHAFIVGIIIFFIGLAILISMIYIEHKQKFSFTVSL
jgi:hypothetical protein